MAIRFIRHMQQLIRLLIFIFLCRGTLWAQTAGGQKDDIARQINELKLQLKGESNDSEKVYLLADLAFAFADVDPAAGITYAEKAEKLALDMKWNKGLGYVYNNLANLYTQLSDYPKSLEYLFRSLKNNELAGYEKAIATNYGNIGVIYQRQQQFDKALSFYFKSLALEQKYNNKQGMASDMTNIGATYRNKKDFGNALLFFNKALQLARELNDEDALAINYVNIGSVYNDQHFYDKAVEYFNKSLLLDTKRGNTFGVGSTYGSLGAVYLKKSQDTSLMLSETEKNYSLRLAKENLTKGISVLRPLGALLEVHNAYYDLYTLSLIQQQYKEALGFYEKYHDLKDSIFSAENEQKLASLEFKRTVDVKEKEIQINKLKYEQANRQRIWLLSGLVLLGLLSFQVYKQRARSEKLLLNILPKKIAERLKRKEFPIADQYDNASIVFIDIAGFTNISEKNKPANLVQMLNNVFIKLDELVEKYGLEKIKTIGDCYMAAGNIPEHLENHTLKVAEFAVEASKKLGQISSADGNPLLFRTGIDCGPVVAGVIGEKKFIYDMWGDAVNVASRMESSGVVGKIQITERFKNALPPESFNFVLRGSIDIKGKGKMQTYFLEESSTSHQ